MSHKCLRFCKVPPNPDLKLFVPKNQAKVGDIMLAGNMFVTAENYSKLQNTYEPVGVVSIPAGLIDDKVRILSLDLMSTEDPENGVKDNFDAIPFGANGDIEGMKYFTQIPIVNPGQNTIKGVNSFGYVPLINYAYSGTKTDSFVAGYKYHSTSTSPTAPNILLADGSLNSVAFATEYTPSGTTTVASIYNVLTDLDGKSNTEKIMQQVTVERPVKSTDTGNFPAAHCCTLYNKGNIDWYLPSAGELAISIVDIDSIQNSRQILGYDYDIRLLGSSIPPLWTSTLGSAQGACFVDPYFGFVYYNYLRNLSYAVAAIAAI